MDDKAKRVRKEADYVNIKRYGFSLKEMLRVHPSGCPLALRARALMLTEDEVTKMMAKIVGKIRKAILTKQETQKIEERLKMELIEKLREYIGTIQSRPMTAHERKILRMAENFLKLLTQDKEKESTDE